MQAFPNEAAETLDHALVEALRSSANKEGVANSDLLCTRDYSVPCPSGFPALFQHVPTFWDVIMRISVIRLGRPGRWSELLGPCRLRRSPRRYCFDLDASDPVMNACLFWVPSGRSFEQCFFFWFPESQRGSAAIPVLQSQCRNF